MPLGMEISLGPGHTVLDGDQAPSPQRGRSPPNFRPMSIVAKQLALSVEVGLGPGHIVLDGDAAPLPKNGDRAPKIRSMTIVAKGLDGSRCHLVWR